MLEVGDVVVIKEDLTYETAPHIGSKYCFVDHMKEFTGLITEVVSVTEDTNNDGEVFVYYKLSIDHGRWKWGEDWLIPISSKDTDSSLIMSLY